MKRLVIYLFTVLGFITGSSFMPGKPTMSKYNQGKITNPADTFPTPDGGKNMLFYVQRTHNTNTIVYELNYNPDSTLNESNPIHAYWIRYADGGGTKELSYIQTHYAYGLLASSLDKDKKSFKVNFVSYSKKDIYLMRSRWITGTMLLCL